MTNKTQAFRWNCLGRLVVPGEHTAPGTTHAALPTVSPLDESRLRLYFSSRDAKSRSRVFSLSVVMDGKPRIETGTLRLALDIGEVGTFADSGVTPSCIFAEGRTLFYYTGWNLGCTVPFYLTAGVAESVDGGQTFKPDTMRPILGRSVHDPILSASPAVLKEGSLWRMWYLSGARWEETASGKKHYYHIRYAESADGLLWQPTGRVCIDFKNEDEYAIGRPCVLPTHDGYLMWYCSRGAEYQLGFAASEDGLHWQRLDEHLGLPPSGETWDDRARCYPLVFTHKGSVYMFYNGNDYGKTGIGLAVLEGPLPSVSELL